MKVPVAVIGGGQAGLAMSWHLTQAGREHVVLEAGDRLGGSWLKRWDSFCLVTPNWRVRMPGFPYDGPSPDGSMARDEIVGYFVRYSASFDPPIRFGMRALALDRGERGGLTLQTSQGSFEAETVVVATGAFQMPKRPAASSAIAPHVQQLHTDDYRNQEQLPPGGVLVVGSGQSGAQIVEELHDAGRDVYLSVGSTGRAPRRYRGKDVFHWLGLLTGRGPKFGIPVMTVGDLPSPRARLASNPHLSGKNGGHDINLRQLGQSGVTLLGHIAGAHHTRVQLAPGLEDSLATADRWFDTFVREDIDHLIEAAGIDAPPDDRVSVEFVPQIISEIDLDQAGIATIIWATGYRFDFDWIKPVTLDEMGYPIHSRGVTETPGLHFLGLPWLHTQGSSLLSGVGEDAAYLADTIG